MAATQEKTIRHNSAEATATTESVPRVIRVDPTAPAGSENGLGAQSIRDGRPATCDDVVEAMDEEGPGISAPLATEKASS
jgi:hypothetical protein